MRHGRDVFRALIFWFIRKQAMAIALSRRRWLVVWVHTTSSLLLLFSTKAITGFALLVTKHDLTGVDPFIAKNLNFEKDIGHSKEYQYTKWLLSDFTYASEGCNRICKEQVTFFVLY